MDKRCTVKYTEHNKACSPLSVTACEPTATSEAAVMEPPRAGGPLESSRGARDSKASLEDGTVDTAKYVPTKHTRWHLQSGGEIASVSSEMCFPFFTVSSESSGEESTGEREGEICAHVEVASDTEATEVPAEQTSSTQTGKEKPRDKCAFLCPQKHHEEHAGWSTEMFIPSRSQSLCQHLWRWFLWPFPLRKWAELYILSEEQLDFPFPAYFFQSELWHSFPSWSLRGNPDTSTFVIFVVTL